MRYRGGPTPRRRTCDSAQTVQLRSVAGGGGILHVCGARGHVWQRCGRRRSCGVLSSRRLVIRRRRWLHGIAAQCEHRGSLNAVVRGRSALCVILSYMHDREQVRHQSRLGPVGHVVGGSIALLAAHVSIRLAPRVANGELHAVVRNLKAHGCRPGDRRVRPALSGAGVIVVWHVRVHSHVVKTRFVEVLHVCIAVVRDGVHVGIAKQSIRAAVAARDAKTRPSRAAADALQIRRGRSGDAGAGGAVITAASRLRVDGCVAAAADIGDKRRAGTRPLPCISTHDSVSVEHGT